ncbi:Activator of Hsp90 ATPase homolog 1-like protein [Amycolatopsis marina]|uniref:Activator of Hsp90 ATPase homolog 1-like protein n=1 Tax=Amycolatopsis marina TaxID=490629 RepID=A0A1I0V6D7_9PSEU|nr:SRPBCC domain-containing protein [Amycolatopsis marina]SFA71899.1 Activator of Hsp90 ATPase homolog 1-like protein [Amycolatopsis marina]
MSAGWEGSEVGRTRDAGWQIGVSKTIDRPVEDVWNFITSPAGVAIWLGEGGAVPREPGAGYETAAGVRGETRSFRELDRLRLTWQPSDWTHDTTLQLTVTSAGEGRARLGVHQERLASAAEREQQRGHWQGVVTALVAALAEA